MKFAKVVYKSLDVMLCKISLITHNFYYYYTLHIGILQPQEEEKIKKIFKENKQLRHRKIEAFELYMFQGRLVTNF